MYLQSFAEKITGLLARPNQAEQMGGIDAPWYMKYGGRILGIVGAFCKYIIECTCNYANLILKDCTNHIKGAYLNIAAVSCYVALFYCQIVSECVAFQSIFQSRSLSTDKAVYNY